MTTREGIEIDYCPQCRGVWLDRGELDKLIERTALPSQSHHEERRDDRRHEEPRFEERRRYDDDDRYKNSGHQQQQKHHKKEGFLGELFDF